MIKYKLQFYYQQYRIGVLIIKKIVPIFSLKKRVSYLSTNLEDKMTSDDCHTELYRNLLMIMKSIAVALNYN